MPQHLIDILRNLGRPRILVVGDMMLDRYVWGDVSRISPEAPIPVLNAEREETKLGGAASVVNNLLALDLDVIACGAVGSDEAGRAFRRLAKARGLDARGILIDPSRRTTVKTRLVARKQQVLRVDQEDTHPFSAAFMKRVETFVRQAARRCDLVIISDYGKGLITPELVAAAVRAAKKARVKVLGDTAKHADFTKYRGLTAITPNRVESELATGLKVTSIAEARAAAAKLLRALGLEAVVMTLDRDGLAVLERNGTFTHIPTRPRAVYDVTGAGDMVISVLGAALAAGRGWVDAAKLANVAGGLEVERIGVQPLTRDEIIAGIRREHAMSADKVKTLKELAPILDEHRRKGEVIVFTNGCFDVLHLGHVKYLEFARGLGDVLVVGLNSDGSVRRLKGPERPIVPEAERAQVLAALDDVTYVAVFEEDTPAKIIRRVRPDVLVKGEDWREKGVVGREFVESRGGRVVLAPLVKDRSTTDVIRKIRGMRGQE
jgi:D-beta-D-heptose 7-phosphate kinase/D-beta-D-heptose 1-phosphate adenosyltransferase